MSEMCQLPTEYVPCPRQVQHTHSRNAGSGNKRHKNFAELPNARCVAPSGNLELENDKRAMFFRPRGRRESGIWRESRLLTSRNTIE